MLLNWLQEKRMFVKTSDKEISGAYLERPHNTFTLRFLSLLYCIDLILQKRDSALHFWTKNPRSHIKVPIATNTVFLVISALKPF